MRSSLLRQQRSVLRAYEGASRQQRFTQQPSNTVAPPSTLCYACSRRILPPVTVPNVPQRRLRSTSAEEPISPSPPINSTSTRIPQTHYEFFPQTLAAGPPPSGTFTVDVRALRREFLQLQAVAHPDLHPPSLKARAEATSARINEAYKTLQNPLLRAQYLLSLRGIDVSTDETAKVEDPELLMEVLEAREEIEDVEEEGGLDELRRRNEERIQRSEAILEEAFSGEDVARAREETVRLRYWVNIKESLDGWEKGKPVVLAH